MGALGEQHRDLLLSFEGYGSDSPSIVFMGQEERLGGDLPVEEEIKTRCDLIRRHGTRGDKNVWGVGGWWLEPGKVNQWNYASQIVVEIDKHCPGTAPDYDRTVAPHERWMAEYERLGTNEGFTFLTERLPFPQASGADYKETYVACWYPTWTKMWRAVESEQYEKLQRLVNLPSTRWVFMYGIPYRDIYENIVGDVDEWHQVAMKNTDAFFTKHQGRIIVRTGFFGGLGFRTRLLPEDIPVLIEAVIDSVGCPDA